MSPQDPTLIAPCGGTCCADNIAASLLYFEKYLTFFSVCRQFLQALKSSLVRIPSSDPDQPLLFSRQIQHSSLRSLSRRKSLRCRRRRPCRCLERSHRRRRSLCRQRRRLFCCSLFCWFKKGEIVVAQRNDSDGDSLDLDVEGMRQAMTKIQQDEKPKGPLVISVSAPLANVADGCTKCVVSFPRPGKLSIQKLAGSR